MAIEKKTPTLDEIKAEKVAPIPAAIANNSFPYTLMSSKRFEDLLYAIFKAELENQNFDLPFNEITLMSGTREQGRDCGLYMAGKPVGLIQCKKYASAISKLECIDEIIKFVLNTIIHPELISPDGDIYYYIAAASGFKNDANEFLPDFSGKMALYTQTLERCKKVKDEYATLKPIDVVAELPTISKLLSRIKVTQLTNIDLDSYLNKAYNTTILSSFFQIHYALNQEGSDALNDIARRFKLGALDIPETSVLIERLRDASSILRNQIRHFGRSQKHISRSVINEIRNAINFPYRKENGNIIFLSAKAGMGKSVAMCDLLELLESDGIPVIAIKADKQYGSNLAELEEKLSISFSIVDALKKLSQTYERVVLMIDQLDVLSQSFATNKEFLNTIIDLVTRLNKNEKIRIVISARKFDLEHNQDLRILTNSKNKILFELTELKPEEVRAVLDTLDSNQIKLSTTLLKLLQVPKNLDVFCMIYRTGIDLGQLNSEYALYGVLWNAITVNIESVTISEKLKLTDFIYQFSSLIEERGVLSLNKIQFEPKYSGEIHFLLSQGIFTSSNNDLQFFHQTFFDYVLARQFHEQRRDLLSFIIQHKNKLSIRSTVRAVIYYSSQVLSEIDYLKTNYKIIRSNHVTYNIKLVIIEGIARDTPNLLKLHQNIAKDIVKKDWFSQAFFENLDNSYLFDFIVNNNIIDSFLSIKPTRLRQKLLRLFTSYDYPRVWLSRRGIEPFHYQNRLNIVYRLLHNKLNYHPEVIINWLKTTKAIAQKEQIVLQLLYSYKRWDIAPSFELLESISHLFKKESYGTYSILKNIADNNSEKAFQLYKKYIFSAEAFQISTYQYPSLDHHESEFLKKIISNIPAEVLLHYLPLIDSLGEASKNSAEIQHYYFSELNLMFFGYKKSDYRDNDLLHHLIDAGRALGSVNKTSFITLYDQYKRTRSGSILIVLLFALSEVPSNYLRESFELISFVHEQTLFDLDGTVGWYFRKFIRDKFDFLTQGQQEQILSWILQIQPKEDRKAYEVNRKKKYPKWAGNIKLKFLQSIPESKLLLVPNAKKEYDELNRKFSGAIEDEPSGIHSYSIKPPLPKQAYEKMTLDNWKASFLKYDLDTEREFGSDKGGLTEHSRAFADEVAKRPDFFFDFIFSLPDIKEISIEYSMAGLDGLIKGNYLAEKVNSLFSKLLLHISDRYGILRLIWHSDYLIFNNVIDISLLDFLTTQAKTNNDPNEVDIESSPIQRGINSVRGAASDRLMSVANRPYYFAQVIPTIEEVSNDPIPAVRASILNKLNLLLRPDHEKTYQLFYKLLTNNPHPEFWEISVSTAHYLINEHYKQMGWYFSAMHESEKLSKEAVRILARYHIWSEIDCVPVMNTFFERQPSTVPDLILYLDAGLISKAGVKNDKAINLYWSFLQSKNLKVADAYNSNMLHFKPEHFEYHEKYLLAFSKSYVGKHCFHFLWNYLLECVGQYPLQCLGIVSNYSIADFDRIERDYIDDTLVRLVMAIYSQLNKVPIADDVNNKINMVLDRVLLSNKYRRYTSIALLLSEE